MQATTILTALLTSLLWLPLLSICSYSPATPSVPAPAASLPTPSGYAASAAASQPRRNRNEDFQFPTDRPQGHHYITEEPARAAGFSARNEPVFFEQDSPEPHRNYTPEDRNDARINAPVSGNIATTSTTTTATPPVANGLLVGSSVSRPSAADLNSGRFNGLDAHLTPNAESAPPKAANNAPRPYYKPTTPLGHGLPNDQVIDFAWTVFRLAKQPNRNGNLVLSPLLLQVTMSLLQTAATGESRDQIDRLVRHLSAQQLHELSRSIVQVAAAHNGTQLGMAAAIFADRTFGLNATFVAEALRRDVSVLSVDFGNAAEAGYAINNWIADATHNNIRDVFDPHTLPESLLLTNAMYFRGLWKHPFNQTERGQFYTEEKLQKECVFMLSEQLLRVAEFKTASGVDGRWVEIPYKGNDLSMILIMPTERFGLDLLRREMTGADIGGMIAQLSLSYRRLVSLRMPKFAVQSSISLVNTVLKMGLVDLFTINAQLPYLTDSQRPVKIDDIVQKAVLRCDELGSEATVVQTVNVVTLSISEPPSTVIVNVDQPFVAMIVDRVNKVPLFLAKISDP